MTYVIKMTYVIEQIHRNEINKKKQFIMNKLNLELL